MRRVRTSFVVVGAGRGRAGSRSSLGSLELGCHPSEEHRSSSSSVAARAFVSVGVVLFTLRSDLCSVVDCKDDMMISRPRHRSDRPGQSQGLGRRSRTTRHGL